MPEADPFAPPADLSKGGRRYPSNRTCDWSVDNISEDGIDVDVNTSSRLLVPAQGIPGGDGAVQSTVRGRATDARVDDVDAAAILSQGQAASLQLAVSTDGSTVSIPRDLSGVAQPLVSETARSQSHDSDVDVGEAGIDIMLDQAEDTNPGTGAGAGATVEVPLAEDVELGLNQEQGTDDGSADAAAATSRTTQLLAKASAVLVHTDAVTGSGNEATSTENGLRRVSTMDASRSAVDYHPATTRD